MEMIDIFDANHTHIGTFERKAAHQQGLWHQTFHCWIVVKDGLLLQLRSPTKANYPDMFDISAAGHLEAGESPVEGLREVQEELGLTLRPEQLHFLGIKHDVMDEPGGVRNREFSHVYIAKADISLEDLRVDPKEVAAVGVVQIADFIRLFASEVEDCVVRVRSSFTGTIEDSQRRLHRSDLIPRVDNYYLKIGIMAELLLEGRQHLAI